MKAQQSEQEGGGVGVGERTVREGKEKARQSGFLMETMRPVARSFTDNRYKIGSSTVRLPPVWRLWSGESSPELMSLVNHVFTSLTIIKKCSQHYFGAPGGNSFFISISISVNGSPRPLRATV